MARGVYARAINVLVADWPADDTDATKTIAADADHTWDVRGIYYSYDATPTGGLLTISIGGTDVFKEDIPSAGADSFVFANGDGEDGLHGDKNEAVVITLAAGGSGIAGKVNILYR